MTDVRPLVWLPFEPAELGEAPSGQPPSDLRYEVFDPRRRAGVPESVADVEFYVPPYALSAEGSDVLARMSRLRVVQTLTAGVDHIRPHVPSGVTLCNGRGIHHTSTAELALTLTLAALRDIPGFVRAQDESRWAPGWRKALADSRVLILGYGDIGKAIEQRLLPFEVDVVRVARTAREDTHAFTDLPELLPEVDVVILVVPITEETRGLVDGEFLAAMKEGALLVNVARGAVIDQDALLSALRSNRIRAAIDVATPEPLPEDHPLWHAPNLLITPHVGGASSAMMPRAHRVVREQLERFAAGEPLANVMDGAY